MMGDVIGEWGEQPGIREPESEIVVPLLLVRDYRHSLCDATCHFWS
jgi:hypothetical protein